MSIKPQGKKSRRLFYQGEVKVATSTKNPLVAPRTGSWSPETGFSNAPNANWNRSQRSSGSRLR